MKQNLLRNIAAGLFGLMATVTATTAMAQVKVDETNFPDANFRAWVLAQDYGKDGTLTAAEIAKVKEIDVSSQEIADLKGIEHFTALEKLICGLNQLTSLDVSKNTSLEELWCPINELTSLDVSLNTAIKYLNCTGNELTSLDVSKNAALEWLVCNDNQLTSLDVSKNTELKRLWCYNNRLLTLDLSNNGALSADNTFDYIYQSFSLDCSTIGTKRYAVFLPGEIDDVDRVKNFQVNGVEVKPTFKGTLLTFSSETVPTELKYEYDVQQQGKTMPVTIALETSTGKASAHLGFEQSEYEATLTDPFTSPVLYNPFGVSPVTWESSNAKVATVDADGKVTPVALGSATITAKFAGNSSFYYDMASYTLKVVKELTNIESVSVASGNGVVYDLQGRRVGRSDQLTGTQGNLPKGIYIVNGKKVVVK